MRNHRPLQEGAYALMPRGGRFGAWEEPELFADDLRAFLASVR